MNFTHSKIATPTLNIPKPIIFTAQALQIISTNWAAKFGAKIFTTPVNFTIPKRERVLLESAQKTTLHIPAISRDIKVLSYGYAPKKVLWVHGWAGRSTQHYLIADKLLEKGYMVISFDGPAHGESSGKTTHLLEFLATIAELNKQFGPFEAAIGHSFGGVCLYNAIPEGFAVNKLVTVGAADTLSDVILNFTKNLHVKPRIAYKMKRLFDKQWQRDIDTHASSYKAKSISIPTLVVHDSSDGDVAVSCALAIRQNLVNGKLLITEGLGHTKILRNAKVASKIVDFIIQES
ncbi:alpha/beta hydrolase [Tenacibaculum tangerinum]|uniref:Alpha/beta hydrolase n=1 Tax=Tenacibaculum tangerinum TaxID=3038772 RepID=A0ABY8L915_9FLAO|nr:alpha/beta hydrolase [Tenacibaculum tangerinum]WGH76663.1 alpha/beta hydrolase [Tenacibaculum tangerinum]